ncbi:MAG: TonB-dependent receptor [bacterium]|nr:TonB-dependent receptor [bacterium]
MKAILVVLASFLTVATYAQTGTLSGTITDNVSKQPVVGAKIVFSSQFRAITDYDGKYTIADMPYGTYSGTVTMLGFDTLTISVDIDQAQVSNDILLGGSQELEEVRVIGNIAEDRKTPVAKTTLDQKEIREELASQDLPMILNSTPGVHATEQGGGDGDARITIRGFNQRNVGVMIDGVPVNDMENGWVYWSNWFGLDNITSQIQVQRGLGATKLAMPSVGGTMNILTQNTGGKREITARQEYGTGNFFRTSVSYKSGTLKNGWGVLFSGSYKQGDGWVDALNTQGGFYYLKVQKKLDKHVISLSGFGAPQQHGQRSFEQGISYWDAEYGRAMFEGSDELYNIITRYRNDGDYNAYVQGLQSQGLDENSVQQYMTNYVDTTGAEDRGIRFNEHWGYRTVDGQRTILNERRNFYHKPQITLKDFWKVNEKLSISNMVYTSIGRGGGQRYFNSSSSIITDENGQVDWDQIVQNNQFTTFGGQTFPTIDAFYDPEMLKSSQILSASINNHFWLGGLSQFDYEYSPHLTFAGGLDYRYYKGEHYNEVLDLLGGDYFVNGQDQNAESDMKTVGDKIGRQPWHNHRDGLVQWAGAFGQMEYSKGAWTAFVNASVVANFYKGIDYFRGKQLVLEDTTLEIGYDDVITYNGETYDRNSPGLRDHQTDWVNKNGFTFKTGANYNVTEKQNVFVNVGYLSRTPMFNNVIDNQNNRVFDTLVNENILAFEFGYGFRSKKLSVNVNGYFTNWTNRPLPFGLSVQDPLDPLEVIIVNIPGMDARHMGIEIDGAYRINKKLTLEGMASIGDWIWNSAEEIVVYGDTITFDARGVHVGDAAQSTYAASIRWAPIKGGYLKLKYTYFDRYYTDFDPISLTGATAGRDSWQMPDYGLMSLHAGYRWAMEKTTLNFRANVINLLNTKYILDGTNNRNFDEPESNFNAQSASVFFGQGIRFNVSVGFEF